MEVRSGSKRRETTPHGKDAMFICTFTNDEYEIPHFRTRAWKLDTCIGITRDIVQLELDTLE